MQKRKSGLLLMILLFAFTVLPAAAADKAIVTYSGDGDNFDIENETALTQAFDGMEPGETREAAVTLINNSDKKMNFYFSGQVLDNIAENSNGGDGDQQAIYTVALNRSGQIIFEGLVGSKNNTEIQNQDLADNLGMDFLKENTLIATLESGESTEFSVAIQLDGDSVGNAYQYTEGSFEFRFAVGDAAKGAETVVDKQTVVNRVTKTAADTIQSIKTGDAAAIVPFVLIAAAALILIIIIVIMKRKKDRED